MKSIQRQLSKLDWNQFRTCHRSDTLALVKSLEGTFITENEFVMMYISLPKPSRAPAKGRRLYRFLAKMNYFQK